MEWEQLSAHHVYDAFQYGMQNYRCDEWWMSPSKLLSNVNGKYEQSD